MINMQIRDVPDDVHRVLVRRAEQAGQSLQQHLLGELSRLASRPTNAEVMARVEARPKPTISVNQLLGALAEDRAGR